MEILTIGLFKFIDNALSTAKNILLYKGRYILSSFMVFMSSLIFCYIVGSIADNNTLQTALAISFFSALGAYVASILSDRFEKDKTYINIITCNCPDEISELCKYLKENKIKNIMMKSYNQGNENALTLFIFSKTKNQSRLIDRYLSVSNENFLREIIN